MRISTVQLFQQGTNALLEPLARLSRLHLQLSKGQRVITPVDDPQGAVRIADLNQVLDNMRQFQANADMAIGRLALEDSVLSGVGNVLQRVRELAIQANSGALTYQDRIAIAQEVRQRLEELLGLANTKDENGEFLFAGYQGQTQPFVQTGSGAIVYNGDQGQQLVPIGLTRQVAVSDSGYRVFQAIPNGNGRFVADSAPANLGTGVIGPGSVVEPGAFQLHQFSIRFTTATTFEVIDETTATPVLSGQPYTDGTTIAFNGIQVTITGQPTVGDSFTVKPSTNQDIFGILLKLLEVLEVPADDPRARAQLAQGISRSLTDLDQALGNIDNIRAAVGARLNAIHSQTELNDASTLQFQKTLSEIQDLDYAEAISRLNRELLGLQAAQESFVRTQDLSLFRLLRYS